MTTNELLKALLNVDIYSGYVSYIEDRGAVCYLNNVGINMPSYFPSENLHDGDRIKVIILKEE